MRVVGVDGCRDGWIAVVLENGAFADALCRESVANIVRSVGTCVVVGVDIPIGSETGRFRRVDKAARDFVGPRRSSVFEAPPSDVLEQPTFDAARELCVRLTGKSLSKQCYALRDKVREVAALVAPGDNIIEVHPEVSFRALHGAPLTANKVTWAGHALRRGLLERAGVSLQGELGDAGARGSVDDVLDAAVVAWSAHRHAIGKSQRLEPVTTDATGRVVTIWY